MGIKISELPLGTANANAVVPATNAAGTLTEKIKLSDIANLKQDWEVASFSANSLTATSGRKYFYPATNSLVSGGFDVVDPSSPSNGDWYFFWNQSQQVIRLGGVAVPQNGMVARYYTSQGSSWTTQTVGASNLVTSVNGQTGAVTVNASSVGLGNVPNVDATSRSNHTGTQLASTISDFNTAVSNAVNNSMSTSIVAGSNVSLNYNSSTEVLTIGVVSSVGGVTIDGGTP